MLPSPLTILYALLDPIWSNQVHDGRLQPLDTTRSVESTYDFVIVGGGTAGMVLANRLTESDNATFLVLEDGASPEVVKAYEMAASQTLISGSQIDWGFTTAPQTALDGRIIAYNRGRCLGGSTAINGALYMRGSSYLYDHWEALGNPGWDWESVFPYFVKGTTFDPSYNTLYGDYNASVYSDGDGPLSISYPPQTYDSITAFVQAMSEVGVPYTRDLNTGVVTGATRSPFTIKNGKRASAYDAYFKPVSHRPNLRAIPFARVERINFSGEGEELTATGATYTDQNLGMTRNVTARREVIVAAGAVHTPQLLMLSGIGPTSQLSEQGIAPVLINDNVGAHLQDHATISIVARVDDANSQSSTFTNLANLQAAEETWAMNGSGSMSAPGQPGIAFEKLPVSELRVLGATELIETGRTEQRHVVYNMETQIYPNYPVNGRAPLVNESYMTRTSGNVATLSTGSITLTSNSIIYPPKIDPGFLTDKADFAITRRQFGKLRDILASPAFDGITIGPNHGEVIPSPSVRIDDIEAVDEFIRNSTFTNYHPCCSSRMLPESKGGVVDSRLRVHGVKRLRIVDASIFPVMPDGNIQSAVYMVAEKAADLIKEDYSL